MKALIRLLIRLGILGGLSFLMFSTNPAPERHKEAIAQEMNRRAERDPLQRIPQILQGIADVAGVYPYTYVDHRLWSVMRNNEAQNVTLGVLGRVYLLKSDWQP